MFDLSINLIESLLISFFYTSSITLKDNVSFKKSLGIMWCFVFMFVSIMNSLMYFEGMSSLMYILADVCIIKLMSKDSIYHALTITLICNIFTTISNQTALIIISMISGYAISELFTINSYLVIATLMSKVFFAALCFSILKIKKEVNDLITKYSLIFIGIFSIAFIISLFFQNSIFVGIYNYIELVLSSYLMLIMIALIIVLAYKIKIDSISSINATILHNEMTKMKEQFSLYEASNEELSILRHDMKNIMHVVDQYLELNEIEKARNYISEKFEIINQNKSLLITGNAALDCVMNSFYSMIKEKKIEFVSNINTSQLNQIDDLDLAIFLANMMSNAVENISLTKPYLEVAITSTSNSIQIKVSNSVDYDVLDMNPDLNTTKIDAKYHGFGKKSIIGITNKYNGNVRYYQTNNIFICHVEIPL